MSGAHCSEQKLEGVWCHSLLAPSIPALLQQYQQLLQKILGPRAGTLLVHHSGGLDTFINSSRELVKRVQPHHPCIKFINCLMEAQNSAYGCLGLYVGVLCSSLLKELLLVMDSCDEGLSHRAVLEATNLLMAQIIAYLDTKPENLVSKLGLSNLDQMLALVGTTLGSKNLGLNDNEKQHLKLKIVEAFLAIIPFSDGEGPDVFGDVIVTVVEGRPATEARVFEGVMYREPYPNVRVIEAIKHRMISSRLNLTESQVITASGETNSNEFLPKDGPLCNGNQLLKNENISRIQDVDKLFDNSFARPYSPRVANRLAFSKYSRNILQHEDLPQQPSRIRVVLFNVPLVFEQSETECLKFTGSASNSEVYDTVMLDKLRRLVKCYGVDIIACQKVVSEIVKFELQRDGVLVLERLGTALTNSLQRLTGCVAISDVAGLLTPLEEVAGIAKNVATDDENARINESNGFVGSLTNISIVEVSGKTFLQLENSQQRKTTKEDTGQEMKSTVQGVRGERSPVVSFLLPALSSVMSDSLKAVVEESLRVLRHAALLPLVAAAGGCFEAALARWITTHGVITAQEETSDEGGTTYEGDTSDEMTATCQIDELSLLSHVSNSSDTNCEAHTSVMGVDEVLAAVDSLLLDQDAADAVTGRQLRQVARVFAKVFANMSVLLSGGCSASSFDYSIDTRTSHLIPNLPLDTSLSVSGGTEPNSCPGKCSCRCSIPTSLGNANNPPFVDLRSVFERQPGLSRTPHCSNKEVDAVNTKLVNGGKVSGKIKPSAIDAVEFLDDPCEGFSASYTFDVTADVLVENYHAKVNAIRLVFDGVVQLLGVDYCVFDR